MTKLLLWQEYLETHPDGYRYSRFCERYEQWLPRVNVTMRQEHRAGEKDFVDFSGDGEEVVDGVTGEVRTAKLFVAVLGASSLTYAEPSFSEDLATWVECHVRALEYFGLVHNAHRLELTGDSFRKAGANLPKARKQAK